MENETVTNSFFEKIMETYDDMIKEGIDMPPKESIQTWKDQLGDMLYVIFTEDNKSLWFRGMNRMEFKVFNKNVSPNAENDIIEDMVFNKIMLHPTNDPNMVPCGWPALVSRIWNINMGFDPTNIRSFKV